MRDAIYADATLGERHDWDVDLMSAELLGRHARQIAEHQTADAILALAGHAKTLESLAWEMTGGVDRQAHRSEQLLSAFVDGFRAR